MDTEWRLTPVRIVPVSWMWTTMGMDSVVIILWGMYLRNGDMERIVL